MTRNASDAAAQAATLPTATRTGTTWTQRELDQLAAARLVQPAKVTAKQLHRTLYSVRSQVRKVEAGATRTPRPTRTVLPYDLGYTSLEAMGF
jgi:hypothetical protein